MESLFKIFTWKISSVVTSMLLLVLILLNFYGVYANKFYFLKPANYIFPALAMVHFLYLYVLRFKITENELPDPIMRNLEYVLYTVLIVYFFKIYESAMVLNSLSEYQGHVIPDMFKTIGTITLVLYCVLSVFTLLLFLQRKYYVGKYDFENYNNNLNMWQ
ncbi:hypothetical protein [Flagellimonas eckloniae]|uniref:Uncharacterized protein n=1 Tax=Flagellimonas eckloniae TaxID=346185 RepID=A0A0N8WFM9_9FLAO|nr:hypothetical protein [Allomuricauda eckloniae]KQC29147.1 hypothetical protein AAY42_03985 [Allomuricauda eckloniae]